MPSGPLQTRFFELDGAGAAERLQALGTALEQHGVQVRLLASRDRPGLYLLVAEATAMPDTAPPERARVWTFEAAYA